MSKKVNYWCLIDKWVLDEEEEEIAILYKAIRVGFILNFKRKKVMRGGGTYLEWIISNLEYKYLACIVLE